MEKTAEIPNGQVKAILQEEDLLLQQASDAEFIFRKLKVTDYDLGFFETLAFLTKVGEVTKQDFENQFRQMFPLRADVYKIVVIYDVSKQRIVGSGSLVLEQKFIRQLGTAGHIEDIVVSEGYRGKHLGKRMIELLKKIATLNGCYKVILDCGQHNVGFYEKVGKQDTNLGAERFLRKRRTDGVVRRRQVAGAQC